MGASAEVKPWEQHRQKIREGLDGRKRLKDIGREIGCAGGTVSRYCRELGLTPTRKTPSTQARRLSGFCIKYGFEGENISELFDNHDSLVTELRHEFAATGYIAIDR